MEGLKKAYKEGWFIAKPTLTESNLPDQSSKVHIVTGGYAGCGLELCKILYQHNATVYVAGRSADKATKAIEAIRAAYPTSTGTVTFLKVDLSDFKSIKPAVDEFLSKESKLHVLTNNAGVMTPPRGSKDAQGNELQMGTNCLGPYLFTKLLTPILVKTAEGAPKDSVRVTWAASIATSLVSPKGGVTFGEDGEVKQDLGTATTEYAQSKAGNNMLAKEFANRYGKDGVISVAWNPGNLRSELSRHMSKIETSALSFITYPVIFGAYTELYAGCSPEVTAAHNGGYIAPWGQLSTVRSDVEASMKSTSEGGTGVSAKFWEWCEKKTSEFA